jgi:hypothetical protein
MDMETDMEEFWCSVQMGEVEEESSRMEQGSVQEDAFVFASPRKIRNM